MHLSVSFVLAAFMAWQAAAGHVHHVSDPHHARMGTVVRRQVVAAADSAVQGETVLPQEAETPSPALLGLMARIKGDIDRRPVLPARGVGLPAIVEGTAPVPGSGADGPTNVTSTNTNATQSTDDPTFANPLLGNFGPGPEEKPVDDPTLGDPEQISGGDGGNSQPVSTGTRAAVQAAQDGRIDDPFPDGFGAGPEEQPPVDSPAPLNSEQTGVDIKPIGTGTEPIAPIQLRRPDDPIGDPQEAVSAPDAANPAISLTPGQIAGRKGTLHAPFSLCR
jgi:hypothetical protein